MLEYGDVLKSRGAFKNHLMKISAAKQIHSTYRAQFKARNEVDIVRLALIKALKIPS